jgi:hypothetical protein
VVNTYLHKNKEYETHVDDSSNPIKFQIYKTADQTPCGSVEELCTREDWNDMETYNGAIDHSHVIGVIETEFNERVLKLKATAA